MTLFFGLALCSGLQAAPHISGKYIEGQPQDHVHKVRDIRELRSMNLSPSQIRKAIGSEGTKKVAVLAIGFPSADATTSGAAGIVSTTTVKTKLNQMKAFYEEVSYNTLDLSFEVLATTFVASNPMQFYGKPDQGDVLIREAIQKAGIQQGTGAGQYEAVMVIHAGYGNESTSSTDNGDIWSALYTFTATNGFTEGLIVSEFEDGGDPFGVWCHEMGHQIGLPDLYSTDGRASASQVGYWDLMDMGVWAGSPDGSTPTHPGAWCKQILGWVSPININSIQTVSLSPIETAKEAVKLLIPTADDPDREYFLVEYRSRTSGVRDTGIPGDGILIWHIDDAVNYGQVTYDGVTDTRFNLNIINNSYGTDHRGVSLVPADGTDPTENYGTAGNTWPGAKLTFTAPDSNAFNTKPSGITLAGFTFSGGNYLFSASQITYSDVLSISKTANYPNPAGTSYPVSAAKPAGTITTLAFHFTRPPQRLQLTIYDFAGEIVRKIDAADIVFRGEALGPSDDNKWVYEYNWDGKNDSGEAVADGLYLYRVKADDAIKVGKLAIVG